MQPGATLTIAMADPTNVFAMDDIKFMTGYNVEPVVASEIAIREAIEKYYGSQHALELKKVMDEMAEQELGVEGLWSRDGGLVLRRCGQLLREGEEALDVTQDVFRAVAGNIHRFRRDRPGDSFRGWLWTITKHKILDHFRRLKKEPPARGGSTAQAMFQPM